jgi:hypothetical protein
MSKAAPYVDDAAEDLTVMPYFAAKAKADRKYEGKAMSEMYYPKGCTTQFYDWAVKRKTVTDGITEPVMCTLCRLSLGPIPRRFKGECFYCDSCLKQRWFGEREGSSGWEQCPVEVLSIIACFLTEYRDYAAFCVVSRKCFEAANGDCWRESDMTRVKRYTLSKEIDFQRELRASLPKAISFEDARAGDFLRRLQAADIIGEFSESTTSEERRLRLVVLMLCSGYALRLMHLDENFFSPGLAEWQYDETKAEVRCTGGIKTVCVRKQRDGNYLAVRTTDEASRERFEVLFDGTTCTPTSWRRKKSLCCSVA